MKKRFVSKSYFIILGFSFCLLITLLLSFIVGFLFFEGYLLPACIFFVGIIVPNVIQLRIFFKLPRFTFYNDKASLTEKYENRIIEFLYSDVEKIQLILIPAFREERTSYETKKIPCFESAFEISLKSGEPIVFGIDMFSKRQTTKIIDMLNTNTGLKKDYFQLMQEFLQAQADDTVKIQKTNNTRFTY